VIETEKSKHDKVEKMVEFETLKSKEIKFGNNNFLEVARKKAKTEDGENEFISISRGFFNREGQKRFKTSIAIPLESAVVDDLIAGLKDALK